MRLKFRAQRSWLKCLSVLLLGAAIVYFILGDLRHHRSIPCLPLNSGNISTICSAVFDGDSEVTTFASKFSWCRRSDIVAEDEYQAQIETDGCQKFVHKNGYLDHVVTAEEKNFPIAYSILMHENVEQVERLLRLIYRQQNVYCIHVDAKSSYRIHRAMHTIASCFDNVFLTSKSINLHWGEFTLLEAELTCLRQLLSRPERWMYYVNLMGREFPLRTNWELVQIFTAYSGANDVDGTLHRRPIVWTMFVWRNENWRTGTLKSDPPHKFLIAKGSTHVALSRSFVDFALNDQRAVDLLEWMRDIRAPDEHFFPTLNHNPHLGVPGAYKGDPDLKWFHTRLKIWQSKTDVCRGEWVRYICNLGVGDLVAVKSARQLFVNKIRLEQDPVAFRCLELWYLNRTRTPVNTDFDVSYYANLPFAKNHV